MHESYREVLHNDRRESEKQSSHLLWPCYCSIVLLFTSVSAVSAAGESKDRNRQLSIKERLTADDVSYLKSLPREERREILVARGWQEIVIPDQYESYQDLVSVGTLTTAYQEALKASGQWGCQERASELSPIR